MEILYSWLICLGINHIILYINWRTKSKNGTTLRDMYLYYIEDNPLNLFIFLIFVWTPLNFIPIIVSLILASAKLFSRLKIR